MARHTNPRLPTQAPPLPGLKTRYVNDPQKLCGVIFWMQKFIEKFQTKKFTKSSYKSERAWKHNCNQISSKF